MKFKKLYIVGILLFTIAVLIYSKLNIGCIKVDSKISEKVSKSEVIFTKNFIYTEKGILFISITIGDGFSGLNIDIMKMSNFYNIYMENYTDDLDNKKENSYKILKKEITLDKETYKKGDSIFGKVKLEVSKNGDVPYIFNHDIVGIVE